MHRSAPILCFALAACGPMVAATDDGGTSTGSATSSSGATTVAVTTSSTSDATTSSTATSTSADESSGQVDSGTEATKPDVPTCPPPSCGGNVYGCTDGIDNDRDGLLDLDDPGCVSVCDDDEQGFQFGGPYGIEDCRIDCAFDGNSGDGDDMCITDLRCDPEDPGAPIGCEYGPHPGNLCAQWPEPLTEACSAFCEPFTIPGCDCFGCCNLPTPDGVVSIWIDGNPECRLDNLAACPTCTSRIEECGNVCDACEICIGDAGVPDTCEANTCDNDQPCTTHGDCECGSACILGCCVPPPPG